MQAIVRCGIVLQCFPICHTIYSSPPHLHTGHSTPIRILLPTIHHTQGYSVVLSISVASVNVTTAPIGHEERDSWYGGIPMGGQPPALHPLPLHRLPPAISVRLSCKVLDWYSVDVIVAHCQGRGGSTVDPVSGSEGRGGRCNCTCFAFNFFFLLLDFFGLRIFAHVPSKRG